MEESSNSMINALNNWITGVMRRRLIWIFLIKKIFLFLIKRKLFIFFVYKFHLILKVF